MTDPLDVPDEGTWDRGPLTPREKAKLRAKLGEPRCFGWSTRHLCGKPLPDADPYAPLTWLCPDCAANRGARVTQ